MLSHILSIFSPSFHIFFLIHFSFMDSDHTKLATWWEVNFLIYLSKTIEIREIVVCHVVFSYIFELICLVMINYEEAQCSFCMLVAWSNMYVHSFKQYHEKLYPEPKILRLAYQFEDVEVSQSVLWLVAFVFRIVTIVFLCLL